jgi:hypothetical protein
VVYPVNLSILVHGNKKSSRWSGSTSDSVKYHSPVVRSVDLSSQVVLDSGQTGTTTTTTTTRYRPNLVTP